MTGPVAPLKFQVQPQRQRKISEQTLHTRPRHHHVIQDASPPEQTITYYYQRPLNTLITTYGPSQQGTIMLMTAESRYTRVASPQGV